MHDTIELDPLVLPDLTDYEETAEKLEKLEKLDETGTETERNLTWKSSFLTSITDSHLNWLLLFTPASWALHFLPNTTYNYVYADFFVSIIAIIPLARLVGYCAEDLSRRMGRGGKYFKASVGNLTEFIISVGAVYYCNLRLASSALVGSLLSNLLLVLGICLFAGGLRNLEQTVDSHSFQASIHLLFLSIIGVLIPGGFHAGFTGDINIGREASDIVQMSRGVSIVLITVYFASLYFQSFTHHHIYSHKQPAPAKSSRTLFGIEVLRRSTHSLPSPSPSPSSPITPVWDEEDEEEGRRPVKKRRPSMTIGYAAVLLFVLIALLVFSAFFLIIHTDRIIEQHPSLSAEWVGLILIPFVSNAAEQIDSVQNSFEDRSDEAISTALGKSISMSLFVIPVVVLISWAMKSPLTLLFNPFESLSLFLAVVVVSITFNNSQKTNWFSGFLLIAVYLIIAIAFWFYPPQLSPIELALSCAEYSKPTGGI